MVKSSSKKSVSKKKTPLKQEVVPPPFEMKFVSVSKGNPTEEKSSWINRKEADQVLDYYTKIMQPNH